MALNNLQWLKCHKTKPNQTKPNQTKPSNYCLKITYHLKKNHFPF